MDNAQPTESDRIDQAIEQLVQTARESTPDPSHSEAVQPASVDEAWREQVLADRRQRCRDARFELRRVIDEIRDERDALVAELARRPAAAQALGPAAEAVDMSDAPLNDRMRWMRLYRERTGAGFQVAMAAYDNAAAAALGNVSATR